MYFKRILGTVLALVGVVLLIVGIKATDSVGEKITETFKGSYSDATMFYLIGGAILIVIGGALALVKSRH